MLHRLMHQQTAPCGNLPQSQLWACSILAYTRLLYITTLNMHKRVDESQLGGPTGGSLRRRVVVEGGGSGQPPDRRMPHYRVGGLRPRLGGKFVRCIVSCSPWEPKAGYHLAQPNKFEAPAYAQARAHLHSHMLHAGSPRDRVARRARHTMHTPIQPCVHESMRAFIRTSCRYTWP